MSLQLEREFSEDGLEFPRYPVETSSTFTTLMLLQEDPTLVALMPIEVAQFAIRNGLLTRLPLQIHSRTEAYSAVTRQGAALTSPAALLLEELRRENPILD